LAHSAVAYSAWHCCPPRCGAIALPTLGGLGVVVQQPETRTLVAVAPSGHPYASPLLGSCHHHLPHRRKEISLGRSETVLDIASWGRTCPIILEPLPPPEGVALGLVQCGGNWWAVVDDVVDVDDYLIAENTFRSSMREVSFFSHRVGEVSRRLGLVVDLL
jgi:hypothetical protein